MANGHIGLALRDAGAAFGSLLESEARRRDQALQREVSLGELALRGTQLQQQGQLEQARIGVSLAEAGARGRLQELQQALGQQQVDIARTAEERQTREQADVAQHRRDVLTETTRYHTGLLRYEGEKAAAAKSAAAAQQAHATLYLEQGLKLKAEREAADKVYPLRHVLAFNEQQLMSKWGPERGKAIAAKRNALLETFASDFLNNAPRDAQTNEIMVTPRQIESYGTLVGSLSSLFPEATLSPEKRQSAIESFVKNVPDTVATLYSPGELHTVAGASIDFGATFNQRVGDISERLRRSYDTQIQDYKTKYKVAAVPEVEDKKIKAIIEQERKNATVAMAAELYGYTAPPPAGATRGTAPPPAGATGGTAPPPGAGIPASAEQRAVSLRSAAGTLGGILKPAEARREGEILGPAGFSPLGETPASVVEAGQVLESQLASAPPYLQTREAYKLTSHTSLPDGRYIVPVPGGAQWVLRIVRGKVGYAQRLAP